MLMPPDLHRVGKYRTGNSFVLLYHIEENDRKGERNLLIETNSTDVKNYLKYFLRYLQNNLCKNMKLSELKEIKIVNRDKLPRNVDARSEGNTVFLSYQSIIAAMDRVGIQNIQQCLEKDIEQMPCEITYILNNLYHELCHMEERTLMPHNCFIKQSRTFPIYRRAKRNTLRANTRHVASDNGTCCDRKRNTVETKPANMQDNALVATEYN